MKVSKFKEELRSLSIDELGKKLDEVRRELFSLRLHATTQPVKDRTQFRKLRRDIARIVTIMHESVLGFIYEHN